MIDPEILEKEAADAETLDDRQLELPIVWTPFGADGYPRPTLLTTEGWTRLGVLTDEL